MQDRRRFGTKLMVWCVCLAVLAMTRIAQAEPVTWWLPTDPHIGHRNDEGNLQLAVADVNDLGITHYAMVLGDCIDERDEVFRPGQGYSPLTQTERWELFEATMDLLPHSWTYILGNHDNTGRTPPVNPIVPPNWFSTMVNRVRIIGLSDEHLGHEYNADLEMSQVQIDWFESEMASNPEVPTIIMSHQNRPRGAEFLANWLDDNGGDYNIVMWVAGHSHVWSLQEDTNAHGLREMIVNDMLGSGESAFMTITPLSGGMIDISFQFRNHLTQEWITVEGYETYSFQVIPEPASIALLAAGALLLCRRTRR
jgi:hypothetical protein